MKGAPDIRAKAPVRLRAVLTMVGKKTDRALSLLPFKTRALSCGDIHEILVTDEPQAGPGEQADRVGYLCFAQVIDGGVLAVGDRMRLGEMDIGTLVGFDGTHLPNHLNLVVKTESLVDASDIDMNLYDLLTFEHQATGRLVCLRHIAFQNGGAVGVEIELPRTRLLLITGGDGYLGCGTIDIENLDRKLPERRIVAARVTGVRTLEAMLSATVELATVSAKEMGVAEGRTNGREFMELILGGK